MTINNIAETLTRRATEAPNALAISFTTGYEPDGQAIYEELSVGELNALCDRYAHAMTRQGITRGERVLMLVSPGIDLIALVFALLKMGAVPVIIDPGIPRKSYLRCVQDTAPTAFLGIPKAHLLLRLYPRAFKTVRHALVAGKRGILGAPALDSLLREGEPPFPTVDMAPSEETAVAFTSGSTGIPKGVVFQQEVFTAQMSLLRDEIGIQPGEVDMPGLFTLSLFGPALNLAEVFPDMDPTAPATLNPAHLVQTIQRKGVNNSFGSPTIWRLVADYCLPRGIKLPSFKRILMAGAPVQPSLIEAYTRILEGGEVYTPYGATEAMPLTMMSGSEILAETAALSEQGHGMCVGRPVSNITMRIIQINDEVIPQWDDSLALPQGEVGEITVKGPVVTRQYLNRPDQTALAKIYEGDDVWHRMGDLGYFDEKGRLWFCGRKSHRVETADELLLPVPCEAIFNLHEDVFRCAVVGVGAKGAQIPVLVVEPMPGKFPRSVEERVKFSESLLSLGSQHEQTRPIQTILYYPRSFPVDVRHNAKIERLQLRDWAAKRLS
jgi:acyl-CoA synthetase (AMP-forming)/AMP-acid ligase II